jgi:hypothetical protein
MLQFFGVNLLYSILRHVRQCKTPKILSMKQTNFTVNKKAQTVTIYRHSGAVVLMYCL